MSAEQKGPRAIAIVGPYRSGKTSLLEGLLCATGKLHRKQDDSSRLFGDYSNEAKSREMGVELNVATTEFMGDRFSFLDCPGSIEWAQEMLGGSNSCPVSIGSSTPLTSHGHYPVLVAVSKTWSGISNSSRSRSRATSIQRTAAETPAGSSGRLAIPSDS